MPWGFFRSSKKRVNSTVVKKPELKSRLYHYVGVFRTPFLYYIQMRKNDCTYENMKMRFKHIS